MRFEDTHGMYTMFRILKCVQNIERISSNMDYLADIDVYVQYGVGCSSVLMLGKGDIRSYVSKNIDRVIFVFDMDDDESDFVLQASCVEERIRQTLEQVNASKRSIKLEYVLVVYAAETVALYQFYSGDRKLSDLVNKVNTKALHVNLLKLLTKINSSKRVKKYDFVDYTVLRERLQKYRSIDVFNTYCMSLLLDTECESLSDHEIVKFIDRVHNHYNTLLSSSKPMKVSYKGVNLEVFLDEYKQQLKDFGVTISDK